MVKASRTQDERLEIIERLAPGFEERARGYDEEAAFPRENFAELREGRLLALTAPAEFGGDDLWWGGGYRPYYEVIERLARIDSPTAQLLQVHSHALGILSRLATPAQLERFLPDIVAEGRLLASVGSEAKPTGKLADVSRAELEPDGQGWRLTCRKFFASLAPAADELLIWTAVPGPGSYAERSTIVMVPRAAAEVELVDDWQVLGMRPTVSWNVNITDYHVPPERIIGEPGAWMSRDPRTFTLAFAANHIGSAGAALEAITSWVRDRPDLAASEVTRVTLGAMSSQLFTARSGLWAAADLWDAARYDDAELASIRVLHEAKRVALDIVQRGFDICGARATFQMQPLERMYRDIRTFTLHFRDEQYMAQLGQSMLDGKFAVKGYAGASTFPQAAPHGRA